MDFIERLLHILPDGGNGTLEMLLVFVIVVAVLIVVTALRHYLPKNFLEYLEQLGRRQSSERFDN